MSASAPAAPPQRAPGGGATAHRAAGAGVPVVFLLAQAAVVVNLLDVLLHPTAGSDAEGVKLAGVRVTDLLAVAAIGLGGAKWLAGRTAPHRGALLALVVVTAAWSGGTLVGVANGNDGRLMFGQWHLLLYGWAFVLAWADAPAAWLRRCESLLPVLALPVAAALLVTGGGGDPSTVLGAIAALALVRSRALVAVPLALLTVALIGVGGQRAALLFSLPPLALALLLRWRARPPRGDAVAALSGSVAVLALAGLAAAGTVAAFAADLVEATFRRTGKAQSSLSRVDQATIAWQHVRESPWLGEGLGFQYALYDRPTNRSAMTSLTHDVYLDLPLRLGVPATAVLLLLLVAGLVQALLLLPRLLPLQVAALGVLVGLLGKAAVESILDKPRLALLAAWLVVTLLHARREAGAAHRAGDPAAHRAGDLALGGVAR
ncbi:O-antigen ligase family protein [Kineococcus gypseus]|uniref:O-antigen ligase family protein n=1 Tax=Kineococcus gypseus TaxID=1637102 RepID=UPI003D7C9561